MKRAGDSKMIFVAVGIAAVLFLFYFMFLGPKRKEASALGDDITQLESSIDQQKQTTEFAEQARRDFPRYYGQLVVLGKAVPEQADSASMLVQVNDLGEGAGVDFRSIELAEGTSGDSGSGGSTAGTPPATTPPPSSESSGGTPPPETAPPSGDTGATPASATTGTAPAPATEAAAASLPIGAAVGPAGLPTLPYAVTMKGGFFGIADFMGGLDGLVTVRESNGQVSANGRLLTFDGFAMHHPRLDGGETVLDVDFSLTSFVTPADQGLTAGATPVGPAPGPAAPEATPASSTVTP